MKKRFVGVQIAAHSFYDEGIAHVLDVLQSTAGVNAVMVSPYSYYGAIGRPITVQADHGVPRRDGSGRCLPRLWVRHSESAIHQTSLRFCEQRVSAEYAGSDILSDLSSPAQQRGVDLYLRIYEPLGAEAAECIENFRSVWEVSPTGALTGRPCNNNPDFRAFMAGTLRDLASRYALRGIQYGAERNGPLASLLGGNDIAKSGCFCPHCLRIAQERGANPQRARAGLAALVAARSHAPSPDGAFVDLLHLLMEYPDMLAWERLWHRSMIDLHGVLRQVVREASGGGCEFGRHIAHYESSFDLLFRAGAPYREMAQVNDFIKPIMYDEIFGPRLRQYVTNLQPFASGSIAPADLLQAYYALLGHDRAREPAIEQLDRGLSPEYVFRETRRAVQASEGTACKVYSGIGIDIPHGAGWGNQVTPSDPEKLQRAVRRALDAGAAGILLSREYEEMTIPSLKIVGHALK